MTLKILASQRLASPVLADQNTSQAAKFIKGIFEKNGIKVSVADRSSKKEDKAQGDKAYIVVRYRSPATKAIGELAFVVVKGKISVFTNDSVLTDMGTSVVPDMDSTFENLPIARAVKALDRHGAQMDSIVKKIQAYQSWFELFIASLDQISTSITKAK